MRYLPHTPEEITSMLATAGVSSLDALYSSIPPEARLARPLALEHPMDEPSLIRHLEELAQKNQAASMLSFLGRAPTTTTSRPRPTSSSCGASSTRPTRRTSPRSPRARSR